MTLEELRAQEPDLVAQIEQNARNGLQDQAAVDGAVEAERNRIKEIDSIAASVPDPKMVQDAKYGDHPCTAQELCLQVMKKSAAEGMNFLAKFAEDGKASGAEGVGAVPNGGQQITTQEEEKDIGVVMAAYLAGKGVKNEKTV